MIVCVSYLTGPVAACTEYPGYFRLVESDAAPATSQEVISETIETSRVQCVSRCVLQVDVTCNSLTFDSTTHTCKLYDMDYSQMLETTSGVKYYTRKCC